MSSGTLGAASGFDVPCGNMPTFARLAGEVVRQTLC